MIEPAYRTISDVATLVGVPPHVLRFWETKFPGIAPLKRGGNRRYYRPEDVAVVRTVARLLHAEGYTIKGAQKLLAGDTGPTTSVMQTISTPVDLTVAADLATPMLVSASDTAPLAAITAIRADLVAALTAARTL